MAIATYGGDELLSVSEVRKWIGRTTYDRVCANGACIPVIGPDGKRAYYRSIVERGLERDQERPGPDDAADEVVERYDDDEFDEDYSDPDGDEILARYADDSPRSPAVKREMRSLLVAIRRAARQLGVFQIKH